jgi:hypothetical protein
MIYIQTKITYLFKNNHTVALNPTFKTAFNSFVGKSAFLEQVSYFSTKDIKNQEFLVKYNSILKDLTPEFK